MDCDLLYHLIIVQIIVDFLATGLEYDLFSYEPRSFFRIIYSNLQAI